ncbi:MAG TPA: hypothetical protein QGF58_03780 [Myxococcota bacterium]|nr:hypothetical protein [Myxococcota bacterium]
MLLLITACSSPSAPEEPLADVLEVQASGEPGAYELSVTVRSPDSGCERYADWWEVVGEDGELLYRRVLLHSHVEEQPFTRSGGPVPGSADQQLWVRAHMAPGGYGGQALFGSFGEGFTVTPTPSGFAAGLETTDPLPEGCAH